MATLNADKVVRTLERLQARVDARFPNSGLGGVAHELVVEARRTADQAAAIARPFYVTRAFTGLVILAIVATGVELWWLGGAPGLDRLLALPPGGLQRVRFDPLGLAAGLEALVNLAILGALALWFLINAEARAKRKRTLEALHGLRSLAHVIDMHQLTKDPTVVLSQAPTTAASPVRSMDQFLLTRYLDYCAEMLALIGKLAALYAARTQDPQVVAAVNDVEGLCTDLGRKIWQKITILSALDERAAGR
ncbi:hypothetical protein BZG35_07760 [Brevundimonas sp. LM2]|uniref:hypothetical protein n=1 Tax=Brevundimonas sp. LM2 TaxID=1938605 RepID=UPI000983A497|nr:hypothetical protein [Brevundimonas sp. LM2]AQR61559.1 hypothetical protein BZG35_07760 [Brevundimonas sp. LM2]